MYWAVKFAAFFKPIRAIFDFTVTDRTICQFGWFLLQLDRTFDHTFRGYYGTPCIHKVNRAIIKYSCAERPVGRLPRARRLPFIGTSSSRSKRVHVVNSNCFTSLPFSSFYLIYSTSTYTSLFPGTTLFFTYPLFVSFFRTLPPCETFRNIERNWLEAAKQFVELRQREAKENTNRKTKPKSFPIRLASGYSWEVL